MFARTERLLLRPSWPEDASALYAAIADEGIVRNLARAPWPYTMDDAAVFAALEHSEMFPNFMLMLRTDAAPKLIGSCGLAELRGEVEIGYWIARPYWGQGFATEAAMAVVDVARALGHRRLVSGHFIDNPASGQVLRKIGFRPSKRVEQRYSAGRKASINCALYELPLQFDAADMDQAALIGSTFNRNQPVMPMPRAA
ncbi:MAG: GNAT family N-acetyltransferase [Sphingorhabdus sp.]